ncbi:DNA repair and recombination protein RAD26 [Macrophomina phaseolina]|uniref:DNA repair and recombination protein RAD26 n=1 Tax=Macrophomina phaseolina TaxID=35725 RepID=A0ABQ8FTQ5_9PEZI|nr:DNA repair and recombination protein RAD26 [Macrophomina phaseolina]
MLNKPFKSPLLARKPPTAHHPQPESPGLAEPPPKKRRISHGDPPKPAPAAPADPAARKPLVRLVNPAPSPAAPRSDGNNAEAYFTVLWRKPTAKKHKTWDGDGILCLSNGSAHLLDASGRPMGKTMCSKPLQPGSTLSVGGKELEVNAVMTKQDFLAGRSALGTPTQPADRASAPKPVQQKPLRTVRPNVKQEPLAPKPVTAAATPIPTQSRPLTAKFKNPLMATSTLPKPSGPTAPQPRHDPNAPRALVMTRPLPMNVPKGKQIVDVVVDPVLSKHLRDHQRQGVQFLYECVMGMGAYNGQGVILADEMGLGKTLQTITLVWTLLKQNPIYDDPPVVKKAIIVCPAGVVSNWRREFRKWLGNDRLGVFVADESRKRLTDFTRGKCYSVMIIGYEKLLKSHEDIKSQCDVDLVVLDEGHKLKTAKGKTAQAIRNLGTDRVVLLSGTPFSNNLLEFHAVADLVNPGVLGKLNAFKREFEGPIVKGQQPDATCPEREKGAARHEELDKLSKQFMLRRTADILSKYLPSKTEHVLLCRPTTAQAEVYRRVLASPAFGAALGSNENALQLINVLKQVCNSPKLLSSAKNDDTPSPTIAAILENIPAKLLNSGASAKFQVLDSLLHRIHTTTNEKVVIVSHYTSTLDILGGLLTSLSYTFLRVDGSTPANKRQEMINTFNNSDANKHFAFLLSAKAGGVGINLTGASRLVLYDIDWNPAHDLQAMARIHRDGQKRPCKIYRLLTMGALDEKIYQRQVTKQGLADSVIDSKTSSSSFTKEELQDLFTLNDGHRCQTHELICCPCGGRGNGGGLVPAEDNMAADTASEAIDDEELPDLPTLLRASQVDMEEQERRLKEARIPKKEKAKMVALMQYAHVDTSLISEAPPHRNTSMPAADADTDDEGVVDYEALIDDEPLMEVIKENGSRVKFVFSKTVS